MTTVPEHSHAFDPEGLTDLTMCSGHMYCTLTYGEYRTPPTVPGPTGPLPRGWHRLTFRKTTWGDKGDPFWVVSDDLPSVVVLGVSLTLAPDVVPGSIKTESWNGFPPRSN